MSLSGDGSVLAYGGNTDNSNIGATWIFTLSGGVWTQQVKLVGTGNAGICYQGASVSLSGDGNTVAVGAPVDNGNKGAVWIFTNVNGTWTQIAKLIGSGNIGNSQQGTSVSISGDGSTVAIGGPADNGDIGATWIFVNINGVWTEQAKLIGRGNIGNSNQGTSVSLCGNGNTLGVGGIGDNRVGMTGRGANWVFTRVNDVWTQQAKLTSSVIAEGRSVALSGNGNVLVSGSTGNTLVYA